MVKSWWLAGTMLVMAVTCGPQTAMATSRAHAAQVFHGAGPANTPAEVLGDLVLHVSIAMSPRAAEKALAKLARQMGADAVVDVRLERADIEAPLQAVTGLPNLVLGSLKAAFTLDPGALRDVTQQGAQRVFRRRMLVVRGRAVRFLK